MKNKKEKTALFNKFSNLGEVENKINKWIEEDYNQQGIYPAFQYKDYENKDSGKFEKANYKSLI